MTAFCEIATDPVIDAVLHDADVVFNLSGGKDCGAVAALTNAHLDAIEHPRDRRIALHADLGRAEWPHTPQQVRDQASALGVPLIVVQRKAGDLVARFENRWQRGLADYADMRLYHLRGPWSSPSLKFCQSELKIQVMWPEVARRYRGRTVIQVTGLRREESVARRSTPVAKVDHRFAKQGNRAGTRILMWNPGVNMTAAQVFAANERCGIPLSRVYGLGCSRHSCRLCIMGSERDLFIGGMQPENWDFSLRYVDMEIESTFSFQADRWLADLLDDLLEDQRRDKRETAKALARHRREVEGSMPSRHRYVDGWPLYVPTLVEARVIASARRELLGRYDLPNHYPDAPSIVARFADLVAHGEARKARKVAA